MRNPIDSLRTVSDNLTSSAERLEESFKGALGLLIGVGIVAVVALVIAVAGIRK